MLKKLLHIRSDVMYLNSLFGMASTFVISFFGFFFWIFCAKLFSTEQVGLATTLVASMALILQLSNIGLDNGLIRFLPKSTKRNEMINASLVIIGGLGLIISTGFILGLHIFSPRLLFVRENVWFGAFYIVSMTIACVTVMTESVFTALRSQKYIFYKNSIFSVLRMIFPFILLGFGAFGMFAAWMLATAICFVFSLVILKRRYGFTPRISFNIPVVKSIARYSFGNYLIGFMGLLPTLLLPLIITNTLGPKQSAYYYIATMIANLLYVIPFATSQSLYAEGSHDEEKLMHHLRKAIKMITLSLLPSVLFLVFFGNYILMFFGKEYTREGFRLLQLFSVAGIFVSINYLFLTLLNVKRKMKELVAVNAIGMVSLIGLSLALLPYSLTGVGIAWIIGQIVMNICYVFVYFLKPALNFFRKPVLVRA